MWHFRDKLVLWASHSSVTIASVRLCTSLLAMYTSDGKHSERYSWVKIMWAKQCSQDSRWMHGLVSLLWVTSRLFLLSFNSWPCKTSLSCGSAGIRAALSITRVAEAGMSSGLVSSPNTVLLKAYNRGMYNSSGVVTVGQLQSLWIAKAMYFTRNCEQLWLAIIIMLLYELNDVDKINEWYFCVLKKTKT